MATIKVRTLKDGSQRWRVEFREGGRGGRSRNPSFSDERQAKKFNDLVTALGHIWPDDDTLIRKGFGFLAKTPLRAETRGGQRMTDYATAFIETLDDAGKQQRKTYASYVENYLRPFFDATDAHTFGDISRLADLRLGHMRAWQRYMLDDRKLSAKTVANVRGLLIPMFEAACRRGEWGDPAKIEYSPMDGLKCPKVTSAKTQFLRDPEHARIFFETAYELDAEFADMLYVLCSTALRWGELIGLHDDAVYLGRRPVVEIRRVGKRITGTGWVIENAPKTESGYREVPINARAAQILAERMARGVGLLFPGPTGELFVVGQNVWQKRWRPIVVEARRRGLPYNITPHGLRKTTLTNLAESGIDPTTLKQFAGHKSAVTTLNIYTESTGRNRDTLVTNISDFLPSNG